jgi:PAS domain S-box-containing protein
MSVLFWIDLAALSLSIIIASSLVMVVMVTEPGRLLNLTFSLFAILASSFALLSLAARVSMWLGKGPAVALMETGILAFALMSVVLLSFVSRYTQRPRAFIDAASLVGGVIVALLAFPLFRHQLFADLRLLPNGSTTIDLSPLGVVAALVPMGYVAGSLLLLWKHRRSTEEGFARWGVLVLLIGLILDGILEIPLPLLSIAVLVGVGFVGYGIMERRFLSPLRERAVALRGEVEAATRELARAYADVERTVEERTAALQVEVAERARAEEELQQRARRLELLAHLSRSTTAVLELDELLRVAVQLLSDTFGYYNTSIFLVDGDRLRLRASTLPALRSGEVRMELEIGREGICGWVAAAGEPVVVPDVSTEPRYVARTAGIQTRSELAVPIRLQDRTIGVLDVQSTELDAFRPLDLFTVQAVSDQVAVAIENARLYEETRRRAERLSLVNRVAAAVGATLQLEDLLQSVYQEVSPIFQADAFFVALYDEEQDELDFRIQIDEGVAEVPTRQPLGTGLSSLVIREGRPVLVGEWDAERARLPEPQLWGSLKTPVSWLGVPLKLSGRLIGLISVQTYQKQHYGEEEQNLLTTIADQVAVAVERARLYEAVRQELDERRRTEETLRESEEQFRNLAEESPNMIFINVRGRIVYANRKCEEIMGWSRAEFYDPSFDFQTLIAPEDRESVGASFARHLAGEDIGPYEYGLVTRSGRRLEVIIASKLMRYLGQDAILGIVTDITVRKRTERLLRTLNAASLAVENAQTPEEVFTTVGEQLKRLGYDSVVFLIDDS